MEPCKYKSKSFVFNASDRSIRTVMLEGQPYFVAKDVCAILGISNHNDAVGRLDDDERRGSVLPTPSGEQKITLVNESGLYHLIFQSRKPEARAFRKWVTSEVLPELRRTGRYEMNEPWRSNSPKHYITRGELINAEILNLLWLIGDSLNQGDQKAIAMELGVSRITVHRVLNGYSRNSRVLAALYKRACENRKAERLYHAPRIMAERQLSK